MFQHIDLSLEINFMKVGNRQIASFSSKSISVPLRHPCRTALIRCHPWPDLLAPQRAALAPPGPERQGRQPRTGRLGLTGGIAWARLKSGRKWRDACGAAHEEAVPAGTDPSWTPWLNARGTACRCGAAARRWLSSADTYSLGFTISQVKTPEGHVAIRALMASTSAPLRFTQGFLFTSNAARSPSTHSPAWMQSFSSYWTMIFSPRYSFINPPSAPCPPRSRGHSRSWGSRAPARHQAPGRSGLKLMPSRPDVNPRNAACPQGGFARRPPGKVAHEESA